MTSWDLTHGLVLVNDCAAALQKKHPPPPHSDLGNIDADLSARSHPERDETLPRLLVDIGRHPRRAALDLRKQLRSHYDACMQLVPRWVIFSRRRSTKSASVPPRKLPTWCTAAINGPSVP